MARIVAGLCIVFSLFLFGSCRQTDRVRYENRSIEFTVSETHSLIYFMNSISETLNSPSRILKDLYEKSAYASKENAEFLVSFQRLMNRIQEESNDRRFIVESGRAKNADDFKSRSGSLLGQADHEELWRILDVFIPIHRKLVWEPNLSKLVRFRDRLVEAASEIDLDGEVRKVGSFLGSEWPADGVFTAVLVPLGSGNGVTRSSAFGELLSMGVLLNGDPRHLVEIIFHEMCHTIHGAGAEKTIDRYFEETELPLRRQAAVVFREAMPSAMSLRVSAMYTGKTDLKKSLYNDKHIDAYAKGLYPLIVGYLDAGKPLDGEFCGRATVKFGELFPTYATEYDNVFRSIFFASDGVILEYASIGGILRKTFASGSTYSFTPIDHPELLEAIGRDGKNLVIFVPASGTDRLVPVIDRIPALAGFRDELLSESSNYLFSILDGEDRAIVIVKAGTVSEAEKAIGLMKELKTINAEKPFVRF